MFARDLSSASRLREEIELRSVDRGDALTKWWKKGTGRSGGVTRSRVANFPRPFLPSRVPNDLVPLWSLKRSLVETRSHVRQRSLWNTNGRVFVSSVLSKLREREKEEEEEREKEGSQKKLPTINYHRASTTKIRQFIRVILIPRTSFTWSITRIEKFDQSRHIS